MAPEFLLGPPTPAQLARSGGYSFLDFELLPSVIGGPVRCLVQSREVNHADEQLSTPSGPSERRAIFRRAYGNGRSASLAPGTSCRSLSGLRNVG
jgi:hypothetical protein